MKRRPVSVTIIGWIAIALGTLTLYSLFVHGRSPAVTGMLSQAGISPMLADVIRIISVAVYLGGGAGLLLGWTWARLALVVWRAIVLAVGAVGSISAVSLVINLAILGLLGVLLFRPAANAFFTPRDRRAPAA